MSEKRWMIYVCPECGDNCTLSSGSEHGFFGTCHACEVGQMELDQVEVVPASEIERLREERSAVIATINIYGDETLHKALDDIGFALHPDEDAW